MALSVDQMVSLSSIVCAKDVELRNNKIRKKNLLTLFILLNISIKIKQAVHIYISYFKCLNQDLQDFRMGGLNAGINPENPPHPKNPDSDKR